MLTDKEIEVTVESWNWNLNIFETTTCEVQILF